MILEVIARDSYDLELINKSKADRIEYCANLDVGGLTPTRYEILNLKSKLPVLMMIREDAKNFILDEYCWDKMYEDIKLCGKNPCIKGVVIGLIKKDNKINIEIIEKMIKLAKKLKLSVTFHKAFDQLNDLQEGYNEINKLGVDRVLTSGGSLNKIENNVETLKKLKNKKMTTKILAGGGINNDNLLAVAKVVDEIHVGTLARENNSFNYPVDINKINEIKNKLGEY